MGVPIALDFGAVMTMGGHLGADPELLSDVLPRVEATIVANAAGEAPEQEEDG